MDDYDKDLIDSIIEQKKKDKNNLVPDDFLKVKSTKLSCNAIIQEYIYFIDNDRNSYFVIYFHGQQFKVSAESLFYLIGLKVCVQETFDIQHNKIKNLEESHQILKQKYDNLEQKYDNLEQKYENLELKLDFCYNKQKINLIIKCLNILKKKAYKIKKIMKIYKYTMKFLISKLSYCLFFFIIITKILFNYKHKKQK